MQFNPRGLWKSDCQNKLTELKSDLGCYLSWLYRYYGPGAPQWAELCEYLARGPDNVLG